MTRDDTKKLLLMIDTTYANFHVKDISFAIDTWWKILEPDNAQNIMDAFTVYARTDTSGFAPTPGKLHMMVADRQFDSLSDGEVIGLLTLASRNASYGFQEEFDKLPYLLRKAVGSPTALRNWGVADPAQLDYTFKNICKTYQMLVQEEKTAMAAVGTNLERLENKRSVDALIDGLVVKFTDE